MPVSAAAQLPKEIWRQLAITLRDQLPCEHGYAIAFERPLCGFHKFIYPNTPRSSSACFIFAHLRVKHLSETCRFLYKLLQPLLYDTIPIDGQQLEQIDSVIGTLSDRPDLLPHIRNLYIFHFEHLYDTKPHLKMVIDQLIPQLHYLRVLFMSGGQMTPVVSRFITNSPYLQKVYMYPDYLDEDIPNDPVQAQPGGHFTDLSILSLQNASLLIPTVTTLSLFIHTARDIIPLLSQGVYSLNGVVDLKIEGWDDATLKQLFTHLPNLQNLHIMEDVIYSVSHISLDGASLLPRLKSIEGHEALAGVFDGRSEILHLRLGFRDREDMGLPKGPSSFVKVFPKLKTLALRWFNCSTDTLTTLSARYPELICLEVYGLFPSYLTIWLEEQLRDDGFGTFRHLEVLLLTNHSRGRPAGFELGQWCSFPLTATMKKEIELLDAIKGRYCPRLREARISWGRTWCYDPDGWMPVIRPELV